MTTESGTSLPMFSYFGLLVSTLRTCFHPHSQTLEGERRKNRLSWESETIGNLGSPEEHFKKVKNPKPNPQKTGKSGPPRVQKKLPLSRQRGILKAVRNQNPPIHTSLHLSLNPRRKRNIIVTLVFYFFVGFGDLGCFQLIFLSMKLPIS